MLFSQERVADFINQSFEPVWESVRPVPIVRIDFGNGNVLTRTLHGNILTSICTPDGFVVDALPGIYRETEYLSQLELLCAVATNAHTASSQRAWRNKLVRAYHRGRAQALKKNMLPGQFAAEKMMAQIPKNAIERPLELALLPIQTPSPSMQRLQRSQTPFSPLPQSEQEAKPSLSNAEDVANWKELEADTRLNERTRRLQIHEILEGAGLARPDKVMRPIYKEVLHADLDDPYLGLGKVLFAKYPFAKEDAAH